MSFRATLPTVARLVRSTLDETVTVLSPPSETEGAMGEPVYGDRTDIGTLAASVTPESVAERIEADRMEAPQRYRVRVEAGASLSTSTAAQILTARHALRWERPDSLGGPVEMEITAEPVNDHGRFLDLACEATV